MKFTNEEVLELRKNPNVVKCSQKAVTYSKDFKIKAVKQFLEEELYASQIFKKAGFNLALLGKDTPKDRLKSWLRIHKKSGEGGLRIDGRGRNSPGRPKTSDLDGEKQLEYYKAQVAYLKAENDFLKQLRAKRAE